MCLQRKRNLIEGSSDTSVVIVVQNEQKNVKIVWTVKKNC